MLGEDHSVLAEFPEYKDSIKKFCQENPTFLENATRYDLVDSEVRALELENSPVSDEQMNQLKIERANLKDWIYNFLINSL